MGSTLRIKFVAYLTPFLLSGCSFFDNSVQTCGEPQEYLESISIAPLIVPDSVRRIQDASNFNIPNIQEINSLAQVNFSSSRDSNDSIKIPNQITKTKNIDNEELSELLQLIDKTISNRQLEVQYEPIYENLNNNTETNFSLDPCLEGPPKYFAEEILPRPLPAQVYTQPSAVSDENGTEEKSRRQRRKEARAKQETSKHRQEVIEENKSSKDEKETAGETDIDEGTVSDKEIIDDSDSINPEEETEETRSASILKAIYGSVLGLFTSSSFELLQISRGTNIVPPEPTRPDAIEEVQEEKSRRQMRKEARQQRRLVKEPQNQKALAETIRSLAVLDPTLDDVQRAVIQNMTDKQILEIAGIVMDEAQIQDTGKMAGEEKSRRQIRKEARQQRRAQQKSEEEARKQAQEDRLKREEEARKQAQERKAEEDRLKAEEEKNLD